MYDSKIIKQFADRLYTQADIIVILYPLVGFLLPFIVSIAAESAGWGFFIGLFVGVGSYFLGQFKAFQLRLQAQTALCQVQIEVNTRKEQIETKNCPSCSEPIRKAAKICRYCGRDFNGGKEIPPSPKPVIVNINPDFTEMEEKYIPYLLQGLNNEAISKELNISTMEVVDIQLSIINKYGANSNKEVIDIIRRQQAEKVDKTSYRLCEECGQKNPEGQWVCTNCGTTLSVNTLVQTDKDEVPSTEVQPENEPVKEPIIEPEVNEVIEEVETLENAVCRTCGNPLEEGALYCMNCGEMVQPVCQECGAPKKDDQKFCNICGAQMIN